MFELGEKYDGFFVEFGAADGIVFSNSHLLEKDYAWRGILSEPARCWHKQLRANRTASMDLRCVWSDSGQFLEFYEDPFAVLSTLNSYRPGKAESQKGGRYKVKTVSLNDLLKENCAPKYIDYLSIDTEGSELKIISKFDFDEYNIKIITVEHNYVADVRQSMFDLLVRQGYVRVFERFSAWDGWYVRNDAG